MAAVPVCGQQRNESGLTIVILQGDQAINNIKDWQPTEPVVRVEDGAGRPVAGATVTFTLPGSCPGARFGKKSEIVVESDSSGQAVATGYKPNKIEGQFKIQVIAAHEGKQAATVISQTNAVGAGAMTKKKKAAISTAALIAILAATVGTVGGVVAAK
jgi:hypothetical protein